MNSAQTHTDRRTHARAQTVYEVKEELMLQTVEFNYTEDLGPCGCRMSSSGSVCSSVMADLG